MRSRFEFAFHTVGNLDEDADLAMCGSLGWEIRGIAALPSGQIVVALQRPLDEDIPLPLADAVAATLEEPLSLPEASGSKN